MHKSEKLSEEGKQQQTGREGGGQGKAGVI